MSKYFLLTGLFFTSAIEELFSQKLPPIQLDRPDQTECPFITPKNYIQVENGFTIENVDDNNKNYSYPSSLWKYGVNENFEFRLITEFVSIKTNGEIVSGIMPVTIGFKTSLWEEEGLIPKTSFIGHITTSKIGSENFQTKYIAPSFRFTMQHTLSSKITLAYNLGAEWNGENPKHTYIYTLTSGLSLTSKLGCYAELYGFLTVEEKPDHRVDGGFTYLVNNDFIIDLSGGLGITKNAPDNFVALGISYRLNTIGQKISNHQ